MTFDISMESDVNNMTAKSIYQSEYMLTERLGLEAAADEICGIISEEDQIATETFMETFRKIKAFIIAIFRKIINVIRMWWKKKAIKRLGKVLRNKLAPLSMAGQMIWLISVISRSSVKAGILAGPTVPASKSMTDTFAASTLSLLLLVCSSGDFYVKMTTFKRMIKETSISDMEKTVRGFRQWLSQFPDAVKFVRQGGIFGKDNFTSGSGITQLCEMASKHLGIDTVVSNMAELDTEIGKSVAATTGAVNSYHIQIDKTNDSMLVVLAKKVTQIMLALRDSGTIDESVFTSLNGQDLKLINVFAEYQKLAAKDKTKVDNLITATIGDVKPLTKGDANMIERSLTEMVDFYNLFTLKAMHFMDTLAPDERDSLRPIVKISKEILHQIFAIINYANSIISDIDINKYDIDLASDNSIVDDILNDEDEVYTESYDDISDEEFDFDLETL